jgi:uncharacterized protein YbaA (DUF1428 family)
MAPGGDAPSVGLIALNPDLRRLDAAAEGLMASDKPLSAQYVFGTRPFDGKRMIYSGLEVILSV